MPEAKNQEISADILEEGCYYLSEIGMDSETIAQRFETTPSRVARLIRSYSGKLKSGKVKAADIDRVFWESVKKEAEGDFKLTFVSEKGFHHAWKSELERLDGRALMAIFEASKDYIEADPNQKFLDYPPPKGYDPLAMDREVRKAVSVLQAMLENVWAKEPGKS